MPEHLSTHLMPIAEKIEEVATLKIPGGSYKAPVKLDFAGALRQENVTLIAEIKQSDPDVLFLAEAFTRPKVMYRLAKLESLLRVDLGNAEHRFALALALRLRKLQQTADA